MPENLLTDLKVRSAKSTVRDWKLSDGGGLFLLVKPAGGKLWRWKYRLQGKENLFAIGGFPQVSLAEARAVREKARALVKQGIHPAHERQQVKQRHLEALEERKRARESSFAKVAQAYLAEIKPVFALSSYRTKESRIRKYLSPKFDGMPMSDIGVKQSGYRPDAIERQLAHVESNKVRATYNKALLLDQRRTLLQDWADYLSAAEGGVTA
ncbi:integrase arm-type DNA-binding domain-containing protein [Pandoraea pulmonicola]|uniref:Prophage CP4-57 integrase n=1 Tax=Pandoraea pulmonicola TaxID=93221 RepID=A0AAJ5D1E4_PANPU|nr:integrase arm-type DNA-binding domain-containing protein [Pandoraea pulmonicola]AJC20117.1 hypothetical protein RO07_05845 [Pandoraea pulmonicola]SUA91594.1 Prophage CP4-57 integrase [Pandoraea pulmonicola]